MKETTITLLIVFLLLIGIPLTFVVWVNYLVFLGQFVPGLFQ